jgi:hypothetical protein
VYEPRTYRNLVKGRDLVAFTAQVKETDLYIRAWRNLAKEAIDAITEVRSPLEDYIATHPRFQTSLKPVKIEADAPPIVQEMAAAAHKAGVGPMAAVAGAIAEAVGRKLLQFSPEVIVENGGDIFLSVRSTRLVAIYAGGSPLSYKLGIEVSPEGTPLGVCTSSGTVGHSLSFGLADAVTVLSRSTALADAAATAIGNLVKTGDDIPKGLDAGKRIEGVEGIVIIAGAEMGVWGDVKLCKAPVEIVRELE